jgi:hypothetical protein
MALADAIPGTGGSTCKPSITVPPSSVVSSRAYEEQEWTSDTTTIPRMLGSSKRPFSAPGGSIMVIIEFSIARTAPQPEENLYAAFALH